MRHWVTRYEISNAIDRGDLAAVMARGHASRCAACQGFAARLGAQHAQLVLGAGAAPVPVRAAGRRPRRALLLGAPLALGAAVALAVLVPAAPHGQIAAQPDILSVLALRQMTDRVSELFASASDANDPNGSELRNLLGDGRRGLDTVLDTTGWRGAFDDTAPARD